MPEITTDDGCPLNVQIEGREGAPVLMLSNSLGTDLHMWDDQAGEFARHFRLIRYDRRGHGKSGATKGPYNFGLFGRDILKDCVAKKATQWRSDPHILGGYSAAKPGKAERRWVLKEPVADRIYFAGEACCIPAFGTVHGAHAAGVEAARTVAAALHSKS